jgi:hypothetical protein
MPKTRLDLTIPEEVWIGDLTRSYPDATFSILAALPNEGMGVSLAEIECEDVDSVLEAMQTYDAVVAFDVLNDPDGRALVQFETTVPLLLLPARNSGVPLEMPIELQDGSAIWELTAPSDRLSELGSQLREFGITFELEYIRDDIEQAQLLTDSQQQVLEAAIDCGYYDTPRTCSLTELSKEVGRAKSTVSETLHRAEGKIIKAFLDNERTEPKMTA